MLISVYDLELYIITNSKSNLSDVNNKNETVTHLYNFDHSILFIMYICPTMWF